MAGAAVTPPRRTLLIDADDTLWENNIYFERAFEDFCAFLDHPALACDEVRTVLDGIERENNRIHGYGALNFGRNLRECYERMACRPIDDGALGTVSRFAERILDHPIELIDGVPETLDHLASRHELILFTKGHVDEQRGKVERSGLRRFFSHIEVVKEKNRHAYERVAEERALDGNSTWMIGNSPKSDINPALAAGLNAVFVPHERTWRLEHEELAEANGRLVKVRSFRELTRLF